MFASLEQPLTFLLHDITFHRAIARASHNPILASLIEMVSAMFYEQRKANVGAVRDLREAAEMHRLIYQALRDKDGDAAQAAMSEHLRVAAAFKGVPQPPAGSSTPGETASGVEPPAGGRGAGGRNGRLGGLRAGRAGRQRNGCLGRDGAAPRPLLKYPAWAAPILSHGLLYVRGADRLVCLELIPEK